MPTPILTSSKLHERNGYALLDSGHGRKLERFGDYILARPCAQAVWAPTNPSIWEQAHARFDRNEGLNWHGRERLPEAWTTTVNGVRLKLSSTDFGHLGVFPETRALWDWIRSTLSDATPRLNRTPRFLNLFAYSGGATLAAAQSGAECCHLDASKGMVQWARENAQLNKLEDAPIRWIVEDARKFLAREHKRGRRYDAILLDPPSFGRGRRGELYKVEQDIVDTIAAVRALLSDTPLFVLLTSHTPGFTPTVLANILSQFCPHGQLESGEMLLTGDTPQVLSVPNGSWARWTARAV